MQHGGNDAAQLKGSATKHESFVYESSLRLQLFAILQCPV